jgi:hypothetical protein
MNLNASLCLCCQQRCCSCRRWMRKRKHRTPAFAVAPSSRLTNPIIPCTWPWPTIWFVYRIGGREIAVTLNVSSDDLFRCFCSHAARPAPPPEEPVTFIPCGHTYCKACVAPVEGGGSEGATVCNECGVAGHVDYIIQNEILKDLCTLHKQRASVIEKLGSSLVKCKSTKMSESMRKTK